VPSVADPVPVARSRTTLASMVGVVGSAITSLVATLCCVGPVAYGVLGAGGVLAAARLQPWRPWLLAAAAVFLALGFWSAYRRRVAVINGQVCRVRTSHTVRIILWVAAILTVAVAVFG
jgi:MerT mercuric transport protein